MSSTLSGIALPTDLFYNTGIQTYVWLLTNRKDTDRRGKVQLIDASGERFWKSMRKSLGSKRREIPNEACDEIARIYAEMLNGDGDWGDVSKIFATTDFGYREIRLERPLKLAFAVTPDNAEYLAYKSLGQNPLSTEVFFTKTNLLFLITVATPWRFMVEFAKVQKTKKPSSL